MNNLQMLLEMLQYGYKSTQSVILRLFLEEMEDTRFKGG